MHFEKFIIRQARLFKNDFLEALTKAHPLVIWGMYIPILSYIIYLAATKYNYSTGTILLVFLAVCSSGHSLSTWRTGLFSIGCPRRQQLPRSFIPCMAITIITRETGSDYLCRRFQAWLSHLLYSGWCTLSWAVMHSCSSQDFCWATLCMELCIMPYMPGTRLSNGWRACGETITCIIIKMSIWDMG